MSTSKTENHECFRGRSLISIGQGMEIADYLIAYMRALSCNAQHGMETIMVKVAIAETVVHRCMIRSGSIVPLRPLYIYRDVLRLVFDIEEAQ